MNDNKPTLEVTPEFIPEFIPMDTKVIFVNVRKVDAPSGVEGAKEIHLTIGLQYQGPVIFRGDLRELYAPAVLLHATTREWRVPGRPTYNNTLYLQLNGEEWRCDPAPPEYNLCISELMGYGLTNKPLSVTLEGLGMRKVSP